MNYTFSPLIFLLLLLHFQMNYFLVSPNICDILQIIKNFCKLIRAVVVKMTTDAKKKGGWSSDVGDKMRETIKMLKGHEKERIKFQLAYRFAYHKKEELMKPKTDDKVVDDYNDLIEDEECYDRLD